MLYREEPTGFSPKLFVTSCFIEHNNDILLLERNPSKPQGKTWGMPAGKLKTGEDLSAGTIREVFEETGLQLQPKDLEYICATYVRYPEYDFVYHLFRAKFLKRPTITIDPLSHSKYEWTSPENAKKLPLIEDLDTCIDIAYA